jgi:transcriptional regulator with XRE-family HTH domain
MHHHGEIIAIYRKAHNMTQEDLAKALHVNIRTIQNMETHEHIRNVNRRWFLVGLLGIPAIELDLAGPPPWSKKTALLANADSMNFFENELALHWKLYKSAGPGIAASTLPAWMQQATQFQAHARSTPWGKRAGTLLSMSYQLDGSIKRELKDTKSALIAYKKSYTLAKEIGNVEMQASTLLRHGRALALTRANQKEALPYYHQALKLVEGKSLPMLRGGALQNTAEAYARLKESRECWHAIDLAEHIIGREEESRENNYSSFNKSTIDIYKGSYALYLGDYERALILFNKGLQGMRHDSHMHSRFMVRKAKALYLTGRLDECVAIISDIYQQGKNTLIIEDIRDLYAELQTSQYKNEGCVKRLGLLLSV